MNAETHAKLREPFPPSMVGKLPKAGITLDYVGHGAVSSRLLDADPEWTWEPMATDETGLPRFTLDAQGNPIALWIKLTVGGVTRLGCGTCPSNQRDAEKVLIGDAIRNAAMRFGVALDLWIKGHAEDDEKRTNDATGAPARRSQKPAEPSYISTENLTRFLAKCSDAGLSDAVITAIVNEATDGRTDDPTFVLTTEIVPLRAAFDRHIAASSSATSEDTAA